MPLPGPVEDMIQFLEIRMLPGTWAVVKAMELAGVDRPIEHLVQTLDVEMPDQYGKMLRSVEVLNTLGGQEVYARAALRRALNLCAGLL